MFLDSYDVIVVGGGHAGVEASMVCARMGQKTLLISNSMDTIGHLSCNPSIGGIGKSHLVKEVDALGGVMALAADEAGIQFRILNSSKGPAVRATRTQIDRDIYKNAIRRHLEQQENLSLFEGLVDDLIIDENKIIGVQTQSKIKYKAKSVVLTVGTFLNGILHVGLSQYPGGRAGEAPSLKLSDCLKDLGFPIGRLKTGTPPRINGKTIDFSVMEEQKGDIDPLPIYSFLGSDEMHPEQVSCWVTYTNDETHEIIKSGLDRSPLFSGLIEGIGPRYCPSIEDKVHRYADKNSHQIFLEPEGLSRNEFYPNGISTSLPFDIQLQVVRSMKGMENAEIVRAGYAIEYDYFDPQCLKASLETKKISGLFFAGQINGTTGYEEAAAQGILAGINAALLNQNYTPWVPSRGEAYIGVMVDDLVTKGVNEPYRMFTSRAEYRLYLREDNADLRLTRIGRELGCISDYQWDLFVEKEKAVSRETERLNKTWVLPRQILKGEAERVFGKAVEREYTAADLLKRPRVTYDALLSMKNTDGEPLLGEGELDKFVREQVEIQLKYAGYIEKQSKEIERNRSFEETRLPAQIDYQEVSALSVEVRQILTKNRPETLSQALKLSGVTPAAISLLMIHLKKNDWLNLGK